MAKAGISAAVWSGLSKTLVAIVLSPMVGFLLALVLVAIVSWRRSFDAVRGRSRFPDPAICLGFDVFARSWRQRCTKNHGYHRRAALLGGHLERNFRFRSGWCWRARQQCDGYLDGRLADRPHHGTADHQADADAGILRGTGGAATLFMATWLGVPVSTTHTLPAPSSASARRGGLGVRWNVASSIVYAWVITIPPRLASRHWLIGRWRCCQ